jgi:hypothetical protein
MSIENNSDSPRDIIFCRYGCGTRIAFDDEIVSFNNKKIPLNFLNHKPHKCPKRINSYKKTHVQTSQPHHDIQINQNKDYHNFDLSDSRSSFLKHISEMIEHDNRQQEQILINQNQIKNQQKELLQLLLELVKKWS